MERQAFRWDDWCPHQGGYGGFGKLCHTHCEHMLRNNAVMRDRQLIVERVVPRKDLWWPRILYATNAKFPDICLSCGDHDSFHVNGRCLTSPTRFQ